MVASPTPVSVWLKHVPGARLQPGYWTSFASSGEFAPSPSPLELWPIRRPTRRAATAPRLLELSAGNGALWSAAVLRGSAARLAPEIVAGDLAPPRAKPRGVRTCAIDNTALLPYARRARRRWRDRRGFDVIYGSHLLCTCRWVLDPLAYASRDGDGTTCGGLRIERASVAAFVNGLSALLTPTGVAIFDQEGGWPFGLEALLHEAATARGLHLHVARGPLLTNFSYVLSKAPLHDDVARDPLQVSPLRQHSELPARRAPGPRHAHYPAPAEGRARAIRPRLISRPKPSRPPLARPSPTPR